MNNVCAERLGKRERTRVALIKAAIGLLAEKGLEGSSIDDLVRAAGMARGTFYNYFQTRDEVVVAVSQHIKDIIDRCVVQRIPADYGNEAVVACMSLGFTQYAIVNPDVGWTLVRIGGGSQWLSGPKSECADLALQAVLGDGVSRELGVTFVEAIGLMTVRRLLEGRISLEEADQVWCLAWRGLGVPTSKLKSLLKTARAFVGSLEFSDA